MLDGDRLQPQPSHGASQKGGSRHPGRGSSPRADGIGGRIRLLHVGHVDATQADRGEEGKSLFADAGPFPGHDRLSALSHLRSVRRNI